ncbi:MAG: DUF2188 domain-containing protein [Coprobacillus sp.]|nr:DUF2188 domain-containing protein [Coprobacillus sp.]
MSRKERKAKRKAKKEARKAKKQGVATKESTTAKKEEPKESKSEKDFEAEPKVKPEKRVYHVSKRSKDGKWQILGVGDTRPIKLFDTKAEAEEYAAKLATKQGATVLTHASKGENKGRIVEGQDYASKDKE